MKYLVLCLFFLASAARADHVRIFACAIGNDSTGAFMGGSTNGSGLYQSDDTGKTWTHLGWNNLKTFSMDIVQASNGRTLYVATGLGVLRSMDAGATWKVLTDWRISEVLDIAVDQKHPDTIYIATAHGPWRTTDNGSHWQPLMDGLPVPYCSRIVVDSVKANHILLAAEAGIFTIGDDLEWRRVAADQEDENDHVEFAATGIRSLIQFSGYDWFAASARSRLLRSRDSGKGFATDGSRGLPGGWCVNTGSNVGPPPFLQNSQPEVVWNLTILAGEIGVESQRCCGDLSEISFDAKFRDVHACLVIGSTYLLGILGGGVTSPTLQLPALAGRQIWTLKSFLVK